MYVFVWSLIHVVSTHLDELCRALNLHTCPEHMSIYPLNDAEVLTNVLKTLEMQEALSYLIPCLSPLLIKQMATRADAKAVASLSTRE